MQDSLSSALFHETRGSGFFRVLAGRNAPFYIDVLDVLERECSDRPDGLPREEAIAIISETLDRHPGLDFETEFAGTDLPSSVREKSRILLDYLQKTHWVDEPPRRDWRRLLHFDAHGATMMSAIRAIARPEAAVFTDKLLAVCALLADESELGSRPWQVVENCLSSVRVGLNELRAMQKSVQRFTRRQLEEETLRGNLSVVFDDFSEQMSHACYAELVRARLPILLPEATMRIHNRLANDAGALADMQTEVLRRNPGMSAESARATVLLALEELAHALDRVLPMADEIDRRTADFTRRSLARFRYLQDVTGERRGEVKEFFERINNVISGKRLAHQSADLPDLPGFLLPSVKIPAGLDSLHVPPHRRIALEQDAFDDSTDDADRRDGLQTMERALREALSIQRANAFVARLPGGKGARLESAELDLQSPTGLTDLISLLLHAESTDARYRLCVERVDNEDQTPPVDILHGGAVERFAIIKK